MTAADPLKISIRIYCGSDIAMGPGKADLLDAIAATGSISGAAKALGMSYRRGWMLVEVMNRCWRDRLVETGPGGAALTGAGRKILAAYRALQAEAGGVAEGASWRALQAALLSAPGA